MLKGVPSIRRRDSEGSHTPPQHDLPSVPVGATPVKRWDTVETGFASVSDMYTDSLEDPFLYLCVLYVVCACVYFLHGHEGVCPHALVEART